MTDREIPMSDSKLTTGEDVDAHMVAQTDAEAVKAGDTGEGDQPRYRTEY